MISFSQNTAKGNDQLIYDVNGIDVKPEFPEGLEKLNSYIKENLLKSGFETPKTTKTNTGSFATFVVEKEGSLSDIKIYGKMDSLQSEELIKILKNSPKWNPGKQNGIIVRVLYLLQLNK
jgi:hypothetical protein